MKHYDERYEDCDRCDERYHGDDAIRDWLRDVEIGDEVERWCIGCVDPRPLPRATPEEKAANARTRLDGVKVRELKKALVATGNQPPYCSELKKAQLCAWMREHLKPHHYVAIWDEVKDARKGRRA